ncbi:class I adenylate-forming enzyme family protein [Pseudonocardia endophytica]|uniref:Fatty-acyl-CoA synthase/long-chain acyl-CoA synthetase n=1 Tax=Pseudonocardia endophytica TaxID=401976 RepID=A0A4R1I1N9_PSEEN|nr:AMP-binding protein [Pseudonocardia endophytica]TCK27851.1 fatty-acyl-CoA synthase/long-chain acyl-CoA synthetase [Pseudonocardia endophytica]
MRTTIGAEFTAALHRYRDRTALEAGGRSWTFGDVDRWSAAVAAQLRAHGVTAGDAVALYLGNCVEFVVADLAVARLGAVKVPVNPLLPAATVDHVLRTSRARLVVLGSSVPRPDGVPALVVDDGGGPLPGEPLAGPASEVAAPEPADIGPDARAAIYFTSGTTGLPKGVVHTQASAVAVQYAQIVEAEIVEGDRLLLTTPLAHAAGLFAQSALIRGATSVIEPGFDAGGVLEAIRTRGITWTFLVPTMIYRLLDAVGGAEEFGLRTVVYGAAPITPSRLARALEVFGPVFVQLYGQTECPNWGTRLAKDDHDPSRPDTLDSCGQASIMADVAVVDDDGRFLEAGGTGEVCLRSPYTLESYLDDPAATAEKFLPGGWIRTGDIGFLDDGGYLHLRDRRTDMVISGGMNVYCREVEDVLATHPSVSRVAVIGVPHDDWGEAVHAVIVTDGPVEPGEIVEWSRGRLAAYARPKSAELVAELPETPFGKIDKKALRAPHWAARDRAIG